jgi:hypothetical protein
MEGGEEVAAHTADRQDTTGDATESTPKPAPKPLTKSQKAQTFAGRRLSGINIASKKLRSLDMDDFTTAEPTLFKQLRQMYDGRTKDDELDKVDEEFYTDLALLQREAIRFEPAVQLVIAELFEAIDEDRSQKIDEREYRLYIVALYEVRCASLILDPYNY